jgi:NAD(P)-dependent dehydrogenase (short-subunit alcohol dehydrogenase family)
MSKTIIVTGGSKGLGLECVRILLQTFQCNVVVLSRSVSSELSELQTKHDSQLFHVKGDVAEDSDQKVLLQGFDVRLQLT